MSGTPFSGGQLTKLRSHVDIAVATALPKVAEKLGDPKRVLKAFDGRGERFANRLEGALEQAIKSMFVLIPRGGATIKLSAPRDPDGYYRTRSGLYVHGDFRDRVVSKAKPINAGTTFKVNVDELGEDLTDAQIEAALHKDHLFDETAVCGIVAGMTEAQKNGEPGDLDNRGYANLLYTSAFVVRVRWDAGRRGWSVLTWSRGDHGWRAGLRVLSPAN